MGFPDFPALVNLPRMVVEVDDVSCHMWICGNPHRDLNVPPAKQGSHLKFELSALTKPHTYQPTAFLSILDDP